MTIMTAKAYYDEARRKIAKRQEPMSENSGWFLKKRAKNLSRLGMDGIEPGKENPSCEHPRFMDMRWQTVARDNIETATSSSLRKLDDDGCDAGRLLDHNGWYCDEENEANVQLAAQAPRLREDVKTLRIALRVIRESATNSDDIEKMRAEMLEICGIASRALEATKKGA